MHFSPSVSFCFLVVSGLLQFAFFRFRFYTSWATKPSSHPHIYQCQSPTLTLHMECSPSLLPYLGAHKMTGCNSTLPKSPLPKSYNSPIPISFNYIFYSSKNEFHFNNIRIEFGSYIYNNHEKQRVQ